MCAIQRALREDSLGELLIILGGEVLTFGRQIGTESGCTEIQKKAPLRHHKPGGIGGYPFQENVKIWNYGVR